MVALHELGDALLAVRAPEVAEVARGPGAVFLVALVPAVEVTVALLLLGDTEPVPAFDVIILARSVI